MGFADEVYRLGSQVAERQEQCVGNEELTKHALILPFFQLLGFDVYNPSVLVPEFKAGWASNKEKVDYAIFIEGAPSLFVEAKAVGQKLDNYDAQLAKYFNSTTGVKFAVITNGVRYKFFTDLKQPNIMDEDPFFEFELPSIKPEEVEILKGFRRESFDPVGLVAQAEDLVFLRGFKKNIRAIFREPSDEFVRLVARDIYPRKITQNVLDRLTPLVRQALSNVLVEMVSQGLIQEITREEEATAVVAAAEDSAAQANKPAVVTSEEELAAFNAVVAMITEACGADERIGYKDTTGYFGIHINNTRGWFVRLHLNGSQKFVSIRLPFAQAQALNTGTMALEEYGDSCRVKVAGVEALQVLTPLVIAAYHEAVGLVKS